MEWKEWAVLCAMADLCDFDYDQPVQLKDVEAKTLLSLADVFMQVSMLMSKGLVSCCVADRDGFFAYMKPSGIEYREKHRWWWEKLWRKIKSWRARRG